MSIFNFNNNLPSETFPTGSVTVLPDYLNVNNAINNADFISQNQLPQTSFEQIGINLTKGWNMIAYTGTEEMPVRDFIQLLFPYLDYSSDDVDNTIKPIVGIIKNAAGSIYYPAANFNGLGNLIPGQGYMLYINTDSDIITLDRPIAFQSGIVRPNIASKENINELSNYINKLNTPETRITTGWNMIGYNRTSPIDAREGFYRFFFPNGSETDIDERLSKFIGVAKNINGLIYYPSANFNGLGNLIPGQGYMIYINLGGDTLNEITFPFNGKFPPANDIDPRPLIDGGPR